MRKARKTKRVAAKRPTWQLLKKPRPEKDARAGKPNKYDMWAGDRIQATRKLLFREMSVHEVPRPVSHGTQHNRIISYSIYGWPGFTFSFVEPGMLATMLWHYQNGHSRAYPEKQRSPGRNFFAHCEACLDASHTKSIKLHSMLMLDSHGWRRNRLDYSAQAKHNESHTRMWMKLLHTFCWATSSVRGPSWLQGQQIEHLVTRTKSMRSVL